MSELTSTERMQRMREFPEAIQRLSLHNPLIRRIMECYAHETILTREEALCQMVVQLSINWEKQLKDYQDAMLLSMISMQSLRQP